MDVVLAEFVAAFEVGQFDQEGQAGDLAAELFDQFTRRDHRTAGGQQVVDHEHPGPRHALSDIDCHGQATVNINEQKKDQYRKCPYNNFFLCSKF